jgi:ubiquinone/menaquinone biosynthesis C-methylase UbiE
MRSGTRKKLIQEYYSERSKDYDQQKSRTWKSNLGFPHEVLAELSAAISSLPNKLVVEVGVGSGRNALPLLEKTNTRLVGLDLSKEMLKLAKMKMSPFEKCFDLILADAEHLPFANHVFDAVICMSTMHYFTSQGRSLQKFGNVLKESGALVYGDLIVQEEDNQGFLQRLEKTLSKAHVRYHKPSQMKTLMEKNGFVVSKMKTIAYQKTFKALMEDKGKYFGITPENLHEIIEGAAVQAKEHYALTNAEMTLFYTVITAKNTKTMIS